MVDQGCGNRAVPEEPDWPRLARLRERFLDPDPVRGLGDYWSCFEDLAAYEDVFAARIRWKWQAVVAELRERGIALAPERIVDFGCGTGIASRVVLPFLSTPARPVQVGLHDRSGRAMEFAAARCREAFPGVAFEAMPSVSGDWSPDLLLISHVLNELTGQQETRLRDLVSRSRVVVWVEPGTRATSRRLSALRDELRGDFRVLAPCTHQERCGALASGERDWCHFFAAPPPGVFADSRWVGIGKRLHIDLRALPYAFLVLESRRVPRAEVRADPRARLVGRPQVKSKFVRYHACDGSGLQPVIRFKSQDPELYRMVKKTPNLRRVPGPNGGSGG